MHPSTYEYLKPTDEQNEAMVRVRAAARAYSDVLEKELPEGPDKEFTIRNHRSNAMWANIAVTRLPDGTPRVDTEEHDIPPIFRSDGVIRPAELRYEDVGGDGGAEASGAEPEAQKKRGDEPRGDEPLSVITGPELDPEPLFRSGSMVALNNPNPPLRIEIAGRKHELVQQGEMGQVMRLDDDGMTVVTWRSLPGIQVMVPTDWLVAAIETGTAVLEAQEKETAKPQDEPETVFPQPYVKQTTADYSEYAKRWLHAAVVGKLAAETVQQRWERERTIRNTLASPFGLDEWQTLRKVYTDTVAQLG